ncbi:MAG TPA: trehalase family glycosidase [Bacteroidales bacterium]|nr:trehalase family glycosidase [Bacteroidales bacterium]
MKKVKVVKHIAWVIPVVLLLFVLCSGPSDKFIYPERAFPRLFRDVQYRQVFPDDKTFADCVPKMAPWRINFKYRFWNIAHKPEELKDFVLAHFDLPGLYIDSVPHSTHILEHVKDVFNALLVQSDKQPENSSLIPLPNDFVIPGGRFREIYYWDTYFTLLGYKALKRNDVVYTVTENMAYLIHKFGFMPNGNRSYYLSRSQPPFFSLIVEMNAQVAGDSMYLHFLPAMEKEYAYWTEYTGGKTLHKHSVILDDTAFLHRYYDNNYEPRVEMFHADVQTYNQNRHIIYNEGVFYRNIRTAAESGWDFSSRWMADTTNLATTSTLDILPVDLNCLLYHLEKTLSKAYNLKKDKYKAAKYALIAQMRKTLINTYFWDEEAGFYFDYHLKYHKTSGRYTLAAMFPLFMGLADSSQAAKVTQVVRSRFLKYGGLVTTLIRSGQQWDAPNGWAPLQWISIQGLRNYEYNGLADTVENRWLTLNESYFSKTHKMVEKYNVVDTTLSPSNGEYPNQDGFGWTNGVYLDLKLKYRQLVH